MRTLHKVENVSEEEKESSEGSGRDENMKLEIDSIQSFEEWKKNQMAGMVIEKKSIFHLQVFFKIQIFRMILKWLMIKKAPHSKFEPKKHKLITLLKIAEQKFLVIIQRLM